MIHITYDSLKPSIRATGHAGYAEQGKDIVCAGVSALFFTLGLALQDRGIAYDSRGREDMGDLYIKALPEAEQRYPVTVMFETIKVGLEQIARKHPKHVEFKTKEG